MADSGGTGLTQGDPQKMGEAHTAYEYTVNSAQKAYDSIEAQRVMLLKTWTGTSGSRFQTVCSSWLNNFASVIANLKAMSAALVDTRDGYVKGESQNFADADNMATAAVNVPIPKVL